MTFAPCRWDDLGGGVTPSPCGNGTSPRTARSTRRYASPTRQPPRLDTVQAYVSDLTTSVTWAEQELKAFVQAEVPPGGTVDIDIVLTASRCSLVTADGRRVASPASSNCGSGPAQGTSDN
ncbi:fibronectin type III-like domain-contianing protein [Streptomyces heilongjiangensis]|uniref:Fibronectin type III-like domain-contianing protein n=1 Tax=Streptomyces heilongjiangensis TaxID=945052 RepID=A0ABW1BE92_9ACTN|nr:fibronectin type III-like domain-contianing protein [Streptomyces heilongjiangensis]MDC2949298.1 fibronectin type III-like domain-contianing protein [Streptomyces heilongjiangensis]